MATSKGSALCGANANLKAAETIFAKSFGGGAGKGTRTGNGNGRRARIPMKQSTLALLLIASQLITIALAEVFGRPFEEPEYRILAGDNGALASDSDDSLVALASPNSPLRYSYSPSSASLPAQLSLERTKLFEQLLRARQLLDQTQPSQAQSQLLSAAPSLPIAPAQQYRYQYQLPALADDGPPPTYGGLPGAGAASGAAEAADELDANADWRFSDPKSVPILTYSNNNYLANLQDSDNELPVRVSPPRVTDAAAGGAGPPPAQREPLAGEPQEKRSNTSAASPPGSDRKLTTLLEDEDEDAAEQGQGARPNATASTTSAPEVSTTAAPIHGRLATAQAGAESAGASPTSGGPERGGFSALMSRVYHTLAGYLPRLNPLGRSNATSVERGANGSAEEKVEPAGANQPSGDSPSIDGGAATGPSDGQEKPQGKGNKRIVANEQVGAENADEDNTRKEKLKVKLISTRTQRLTAAAGNGEDAEEEDGGIELGDSNDKTGALLAAGASEPKVSLIRQSNLVMPLGSHDDLYVHTIATKNPESLLGRYIYAPTQHYYVSSAAAAGHSGPADSAGGLQTGGPLFARHFQPGDQIYGSYGADAGSLRYALGPNGKLGDGPKTNDAYFLVMVAAFCVMAMAVVLAAGLFAYRVQQNRKTSPEQDYPTYGVVGPNNNMNGKCGGAAAFMGGYFGHNIGHGAANGSAGASCGGGGGPAYGSKSDSAKHLPDLYAGGSDSGLDKSSAGKKGSGSTDQSIGSGRSNVGSLGGGSGGGGTFVANQDAARMYHYQHQKQQMIISDRNSANGRHTSASDLDSEDENDDGSYTVYECPGLASAHEMEIKNPLFNDEQTSP